MSFSPSPDTCPPAAALEASSGSRCLVSYSLADVQPLCGGINGPCRMRPSAGEDGGQFTLLNYKQKQ